MTYKGRKFNTKSENTIIYATSLPCTDSPDLLPRPVRLNYFIHHSFLYNDSIHQHVFASVSWLKQHPAKDSIGKPMEIWWKDLYDNNQEPFIPLQLLICHSVFGDIVHEEQTVYIMCPVHNISKL